MKQLIVFASGSGSNFQALMDAKESGQLAGIALALLVASRPGIKALERAKRAGIPSLVLEKRPSAESLLEHLAPYRPDMIALAGYLQRLPSAFIREIGCPILNIHPSLLPRHGGKGFYGLRPHEAVLAAGERRSGATVHRVTADYDQGEILAQASIAIPEGSTAEALQAKVLQLIEHRLYPRVIAQYLAGEAAGSCFCNNGKEHRCP